MFSTHNCSNISNIQIFFEFQEIKGQNRGMKDKALSK